MNKNKKQIYNILRRTVQIIFFFLLPSLFIQIFSSLKSIFMFVIHQEGSWDNVIAESILLIIVSIVTALGGRFFCGWMCAFGSMGDLLYKLPRIKNKNPRKYLTSADSYLKWFKYIILGVNVVLIWGIQLFSIPAGTNPWDLFGILSSFGNWPSVSDLFPEWIIAGILFLFIITGSLFVERFFCRYLCPLGAYFTIISRFRPLFVVKKKTNCGKCTLCTKKCSMGINLKEVDKVTAGECINCMECTLNCPQSNAHMEIGTNDINAIAVGTISCAVVAGGYYLGNFTENKVLGTTDSQIASVQISTENNGVAADIPDGTYMGCGNGFRGQTTVSVDITNGIITGVTIESTNDDAEYINRSAYTVISEIVANQSTNVDTVSGATFSSNGVISAVENALASACSVGETTSTDSSSINLEDGTYEGSGIGFRGETAVSVEVSNGMITNITIDSYVDDQDWFERAATTVVQEIIDNQSVDVDAVSGATYSSNGIKEAVANAVGLDYTPSTVQSGGHGRR